MANSLPISIRFGSLPINFQGTPQEVGDAIAARLTIVAQQSFALFVTGAAEPFSNVGPWLDTGTSPIGVWKNWDDVTGKYQPITLIDEQLGYILSVNAPDPTKFKVWVKLLSTGKADSINTFFNGAWVDVYTDKLAALQAAVSAVIPPPTGAGKVLTSTGPSTPTVWSDVPSVPIGVFYPFAGTSLPTNHLWCLGQVVPITLYPLLFAALGTTWGGDGVSNFGIPNTPGRTLVGAGLGTAADATNWPLATERGTETHVLTVPQLAKHGASDHPVLESDASGAFGLTPAGGSKYATLPDFGDDQPHPNVQPSIAVNFIIKYQ